MPYFITCLEKSLKFMRQEIEKQNYYKVSDTIIHAEITIYLRVFFLLGIL